MSCGTDKELLRLLVADALSQAIAEGRVQGGLNDCTGGRLPAGSRTAQCADVEQVKQAADAAVKEFVKATERDTVLTDVSVTGTTLALTDSSGNRFTVELPQSDVAALLCAALKGRKQYHATLQLALDEADCGTMRRVAWIYHPDDMRDPAADTQLTDCDNRTIGWLYSAKPAGVASVEITAETGEMVGYALAAPSIEYLDCK